MSPLPAIAALLLIVPCLPAWAQPPESTTFTAVASNGLLGSPANAVRTADFLGGYTLGRIDYSGTMTSMHTATWASDARILITAPFGQTATIIPAPTTGQFSTLNFSGSFFMPIQTAPAGQWSFRFYEIVDNGGPSEVDAMITITFTLTDEPPAPPPAVDLGVISSPGLLISNVALGAAQVRWYRFTLPQVIAADRATFLDLHTDGSISIQGEAVPFPDDTELAIYDSLGRLVAADDDSGPGFTSALTFGAGGRAPIGDSLPFDGRDGPLLPRTYYLAVAWNNATFGAERWEVTGSGALTGTVQLAIETNASESFPCTADWNGDGTVNSSDISSFITTWLSAVTGGPPLADINDDQLINSNDIAAFITAWLAAVGVGC